MLHILYIRFTDTGSSEEELGSSEESGKDWDELEAEAKRGLMFTPVILLAYSVKTELTCAVK